MTPTVLPATSDDEERNLASSDPLDEYLKRVEELRAVIALLPPDPAERLRLRRSLGLSRSELAAVAGMAETTLKKMETIEGYVPRAVEVHVLSGLAIFYATAGYELARSDESG
jgi:hypothetical protein